MQFWSLPQIPWLIFLLLTQPPRFLSSSLFSFHPFLLLSFMAHIIRTKPLPRLQRERGRSSSRSPPTPLRVRPRRRRIQRGSNLAAAAEARKKTHTHPNPKARPNGHKTGVCIPSTKNRGGLQIERQAGGGVERQQQHPALMSGKIDTLALWASQRELQTRVRARLFFSRPPPTPATNSLRAVWCGMAAPPSPTLSLPTSAPPPLLPFMTKLSPSSSFSFPRSH